MSIPRIRNVRDAIAELHAQDADCVLTEYSLRRLIKSGAVPHIQAGRRVMLNMDELYASLIKASAPLTGIHRIR